MPQAFDEQVTRCAAMLEQAQNVVLLSGAGMSTSAGIPDFRGPNGLYRTAGIADPERIFDLSEFSRNPALFYRFHRAFLTLLDTVRPTFTHQFFAALEQNGHLKGIVTQNIDGLHQQAGSKRVFEVHGNLTSCRCMACKDEFPAAVLREQLAAGAEVPLSPCCKAVLRPSVVLFGDRMADDFAAAQQEAFRSDFALVVGTSLTVYPAAEIPLAVGRFAIVNRDETGYDDRAELRIAGPIGETLAKVVEYVREKREI